MFLWSFEWQLANLNASWWLWMFTWTWVVLYWYRIDEFLVLCPMSRLQTNFHQDSLLLNPVFWDCFGPSPLAKILCDINENGMGSDSCVPSLLKFDEKIIIMISFSFPFVFNARCKMQDARCIFCKLWVRWMGWIRRSGKMVVLWAAGASWCIFYDDVTAERQAIWDNFVMQIVKPKTRPIAIDREKWLVNDLGCLE